MRFLSEWANAFKFSRLDPSLRSIVFYSEGRAFWQYFAPVIEHLTGPLGRRIAYLTSDAEDPVLRTKNANILPFSIGDGPARTFAFMGLQADVCVMTMPDLETFHVKRSRSHPVHYAYIFHSMASTHMVYRREAYDHFDTILCVGPHHKEEIRRQEKLYNLKAKSLAEHGYAILDSMLAENARRGRKPAGPRKNVLIGPSWDPRGLLNTCGERLVELLLKSSYQVVLRPHPISFKKSKAVIDAITRRFGQDPLFRLETSTTTQDSLYDSDIMIADWSGLSMEYAFGLERPQVFIDVPRKVNNPSYQDLGLEPVEAAFREDVGAVVTPGELEKVPAAIERLCADPARFKDRIAALREKYVYNPGASGPAGAKIIAELADRARQQVAHV